MTSIQPPLDRPLSGATLPQAVGRFFNKYATFTGRASRSEFWWVYVFLVVVFTVGAIGIALLGGEASGARDPGPGALILIVPLTLFLLVMIVPAIALLVRRLHDVNMSGLLALIAIVPYLGGFVLLILALLPSNPSGAQYDTWGTPSAPPQGSAEPPTA